MATIRPITIDELVRLGLDDNERLYWDRKPVVTEQRITLQAWVNTAVIPGALSTAMLATVQVLRFCGYGA